MILHSPPTHMPNEARTTLTSLVQVPHGPPPSHMTTHIRPSIPLKSRMAVRLHRVDPETQKWLTVGAHMLILGRRAKRDQEEVVGDGAGDGVEEDTIARIPEETQEAGDAPEAVDGLTGDEEAVPTDMTCTYTNLIGNLENHMSHLGRCLQHPSLLHELLANWEAPILVLCHNKRCPIRQAGGSPSNIPKCNRNTTLAHSSSLSSSPI